MLLYVCSIRCAYPSVVHQVLGIYLGSDSSLFLTLARCSLLETPDFCFVLSLSLKILRHSSPASPKGVHRPAPRAYAIPNAPHTSGPPSAICSLIFPDVLTSCGCCSKLPRILWLRIALNVALRGSTSQSSKLISQ